MSFWVINLLTALASFAIAGLSGIFLVPFLHKIKFGQPIKIKDGPQWHAKKQGTPTMGGFMFIISTIITSIGGYWIYRLNSGIDVTDSESFHPFYRMLSCVVFAALFGLIGFIDDYTKVARKDNDGLSPMQKSPYSLFSRWYSFLQSINSVTARPESTLVSGLRPRSEYSTIFL